MYLEISDRQTGKTGRLINEIYKDKHEYDIQILMGISFLSLKQLKRNIIGNNKVKICLSYDKLHLLIAENPGKKVRLYVDEFMYSTAFANNFKEFKTNYLELLMNGYFASSPNSSYTNVLYEMQQLNNGEKLTVVKTKSISL